MRDLIRFLLLVPLRRNEASELVWSEIDFNHQRLVISGGRMKNGEPHELPLSAPAIALLKGRQPAGARPSALVFPTAANKPHANWGAVINRIRKAIGESETTKDLRFTFHDIRRGFVSHLAELFDVDALGPMPCSHAIRRAWRVSALEAHGCSRPGACRLGCNPAR